MSTNTTKGKLKVFCCGGAGVNIGSRLETYRNHAEVGFADLDIAYIDTSRSNVRAHIDSTNAYLFPNTDGSGQVRAENHPVIKESIRDILQKHAPADINVVVSSGGGGSGSVIAPLLVAELLARDIPVIVVCIGSADTRKEADNTLKTLKSYENIAQTAAAPVVMYYVQNGSDTPRARSDKLVEEMIVTLCALYSRENLELDSRDLYNFLHFDRVTPFKPCLATLSLVDPTTDISIVGHVLSVATLAKADEDTKFPILPEYQIKGFIPAGVKPEVERRTPVHFVVSDGLMAEAAASITKLLKDIEQQQAARIKRTSLLSSNDQASDGGLIL